MSYNGSGTFVINSAGQPVVTGTVISSTAFNALTADLATGLSTAITKDGQTTTTSRILFAQGISSTLTTDATSTTTGSIITAGGISTQKALFVGTTGNVVGNLNVGGTNNVATGTISIGVANNATVLVDGRLDANGNTYGYRFVNGSAGTAATTLAVLGNGTHALQQTMFGTAWTTSGINRQGGGLITCDGPGGLTLTTGAAQPIYFGINSVEKMRLDASGNLGIGMTPSNILDITQTQDTASNISLRNSSTGTSASSRVYLGNSVSATSGRLITWGSGFTSTGVYRQDGLLLEGVGAGGVTISANAVQPIYFGINGTEVARINSSGFIVGTGTTPALITLNGQSGTGASKGWAILPQVAGVAAGIIGSENYVFGSADTNLVIQAATGKSVKIFSNAGGTGVTINSAGTVTMGAYGAGTATFDGSGNITSSDIRIKYDVAEFVTPPGVLEAITPKTFKLISERDNVAVTFDKDGEKTSTPTPIDDTHIGFIANDIQSILPDAVDWSNTEDEILNYSDRALIAVLWNETKALKARLAALENK